MVVGGVVVVVVVGATVVVVVVGATVVVGASVSGAVVLVDGSAVLVDGDECAAVVEEISCGCVAEGSGALSSHAVATKATTAPSVIQRLVRPNGMALRLGLGQDGVEPAEKAL